MVASAPVGPWPGAAGAAVKLLVRENGLYRVDHTALLAAGLDATVDARQLALFLDGQPQPLRIIGGQDGTFDPSDSIEFYGTGRDDAYGDVSVYWLATTSNGGPRLPSTSLGPWATAPHAAEWMPLSQIDEKRMPRGATGGFPFVVTRQERTTYFAALLNGDQTNFFGAIVAEKPVEQTLEVHHRATSRPYEDIRDILSVALQGVSLGQHRVKVDLNGVDVGIIDFVGRQRGSLEVPVTALGDGTNQVRLTRLGGDTDVSLVDFVRLSYRHAFVADGDRLMLITGGDVASTVKGFSVAAVRALDVTQPSAPEELAVAVRRAGSGYAATVRPERTGSRQILFFTAADVHPPVGIEAHPPQELELPTGADLVILSHSTFLPTLGPLKALREARGVRTAVMDVSAVYDAFSYGHKSVRAIRDFLGWARQTWSPAPRFLLLVGDATFDPRNFLVSDKQDFLPAALVDTAYMETVSDDWLVDLDEDERPDMAVGRLPARTLEEANLMVSKIVAWRGVRGDWRNDVLMIAGWDGKGLDFHANSGRARQFLPAGVRTQEMLIDADGMADAKTRFLKELAAGSMVVNYFGHGSVEVWNGTGFMTSAEANALTNAPHLPLFLSMTCLNNFFHDVYSESLAEALLRAPSGGGVAVFGSSTLTQPDQQEEMDGPLLRALFQGLGGTLGDAILVAKQATSDRDVRRSWLLLGDPSMPLDPDGPSGGASDVARNDGRGGCQIVASPVALPALLVAFALVWLGLRVRRGKPRR